MLTLGSLEQLAPIVAEILPELKGSTLVHTYSLLAMRLNMLLRPY